MIYVLTHDSIGVGEDGPTHQPIEHLAIARATPGLIASPADANETSKPGRSSWISPTGPSRSDPSGRPND